MRVLWLLCARGGSKGVVRKNMRTLGGLSLIASKLRGARAAMRSGDQLVCSTEDSAIAQEALDHGCAWVIDRPAELATDTASTNDVVWHAMKQVRDGGHRYEAVVLLEPSSPFTTPDQYRAGIEALERGMDAAIGMRLVEPNTAFVTNMRADGCIADLAASIARMQRSRRQDFAAQWTPSGGLYVARWSMLEATRSFYGSYKTHGVLCDGASGLEIDTMENLAYAEYLVERGLV